MKRVPTPARASSSSADLLNGLNLQGPKELFLKLPDHLKEQARQDLFRRLLPELVAWQEHWDNDDDALEPEEPLTDEEDTPLSKRQRAADCRIMAGPVEAVWAGNGQYYGAKVVANDGRTVTVDWNLAWSDEATLHNKVPLANVRRPSIPAMTTFLTTSAMSSSWCTVQGCRME
eukprot:TRINITY_DN20339_c0_g1_i3.p1 TRINITY_DN20339_c0_g1~~TRINITY_DN20339_c0_g1_i3.p1  ORF type:complete len:174 (-),score=31.92 TRINITY_DN20339_c0_g1_i3:402-923(-)